MSSATSPTRTRSVTASRSTACGCSRPSRCRRCPFGDPAAGPPRRRGREGRASRPRRVRPRRAAGDDRPAGPARRRDVPAQQPQQAQRRHRPQERPRAASCSSQLVPHFDVVAENFKAGTMDRLGLGYDDVAKVHPRIDLPVDLGLRQHRRDAVPDWPAYAPIVEAMSGIYEYKRPADQPPVPAPAGALGDIGTAMFGVIGVLAALRHRDQHRRGAVRRRRDVRRDGRR